LHLLLVGSGRDDENLHRRIAASGLDNIVWINQYLHDRQLLWRYLSASDVYTLPSRHEGFAVAAIEAMACGLPIVACKVSGVMDLFEDGERSGGVVVPPEDPLALAAGLGRVLEDEERRRKLGADARMRAEQTYSLEVIGRRLWNFMVVRANLDRRETR
jgi:glycosyltransferase involved in cell wall biosynthesis